MLNDLRYELHNVLSGKSQIGIGTIIQTIASYLNDGEESGTSTENGKHFKKQEAKKLEDYLTKQNLWIDNIDFSQYVSSPCGLGSSRKKKR